MIRPFVSVLGNAAAFPIPNRFSTAVYFKMEQFSALLDCGEGAQILFRKFQYKPFDLNAILISHMHGDHVLGLVGLLTSLSMFGRSEALTIIGPVALQDFIQQQLKSISTTLKYEINYISVRTDSPTLVFQHPRINITAFPLNHRIETYGYLLEEPLKTLNIRPEAIQAYDLSIEQIKAIKQGADLTLSDHHHIPNQDLTKPRKKSLRFAFCTDTRFEPAIIPWIQGADALYHEATFLEEDQETAQHTGHSTTADAASIAQQAEIGKLILGHFSTRYKNIELFFSQAKQLFPNTVAYKLGQEIFLD